jgi:hypothetical protein
MLINKIIDVNTAICYTIKEQAKIYDNSAELIKFIDLYEDLYRKLLLEDKEYFENYLKENL